MKLKTTFITLLFATIVAFAFSCKQKEVNQDEHQTSITAADKNALPSWNDGTAKKSIIDFIRKTTTEGSADFVPVPDRIACFDNDGTLWSEQPVYFQLFFAIDRIKALAPQHPEWKSKPHFKALMDGDIKAAFASGEKELLEIVAATHSGMTTDEFSKIVTDWIVTATHPVTKKHFNEMVYQPMVELLNYLRMNNYKTFIVSGGGVDFMRPWVQKAYGIPPDQVIGSSGKVKYEVHPNGKPVLVKLPEMNFVNNNEGKPEGIHQYIGKRPIFTAGNSDGDYSMLQYTSTGIGPHFGLIIHHTDADREFAYDRASNIGQLEKCLDDATKYNWLVVDMKTDWKKVFSYE